MKNAKSTICIIYFLHFILFDPASSVRFTRGYRRYSNQYQRYTNQYQSYTNKEQEYFRRRGGVPLEMKKTLFLAGSVFVALKLRHLLFKQAGSFAIRPDFNFEEATVCNGHHVSGSMYFMCPVDIPVEVVGNWSSQAELLASDFYGRQGVQLFCCELPQRQYCCDFQAFQRRLDAANSLASNLALILVTVILSVLFVGIIAGVLIYCFCCRNRGPGFGFSMPKFGKFNR